MQPYILEDRVPAQILRDIIALPGAKYLPQIIYKNVNRRSKKPSIMSAIIISGWLLTGKYEYGTLPKTKISKYVKEHQRQSILGDILYTVISVAKKQDKNYLSQVILQEISKYPNIERRVRAMIAVDHIEEKTNSLRSNKNLIEWLEFGVLSKEMDAYLTRYIMNPVKAIDEIIERIMNYDDECLVRLLCRCYEISGGLGRSLSGMGYIEKLKLLAKRIEYDKEHLADINYLFNPLFDIPEAPEVPIIKW